MDEKLRELLIKIKKEKPFILSTTKYFPLDLIVDGLRSIGAFAMTSNAEQEIEELMQISKAVVINLGRLDDKFIHLCERICEVANELNKPIILDPVGAGASRYRTETSINFIKNYKIAVVRGYPNEISALLNEQLTMTSGIAAGHATTENAKELSKKYKMTVVVSGKFNTVIEQDKIDHYNFDSAILNKVGGIASLLSSLIGAFHAVEENRFVAATTAVAYYAACVGTARNKANGPGTFKAELIDELFINSHKCI